MAKFSEDRHFSNLINMSCKVFSMELEIGHSSIFG